jgi:hypothetical protein
MSWSSLILLKGGVIGFHQFGAQLHHLF